MKKVLFWLCILLTTGCIAPVKPINFINRATWHNTTKDKLYSACLTSLQVQGFNIYPSGTSKESGLIIAEREPFVPIAPGVVYQGVEGFYRLQIMVSEVQDNKIMVDINVKASWRGKAEGILLSKEHLQNCINNQLAEDMEQLFLQMENLVGKADYYRRVTLQW